MNMCTVQEKRNKSLLNLTKTSVSLLDAAASTPQTSFMYKKGFLIRYKALLRISRSF